MSSRYEDTRTDGRRVSSDRTVDDREPGQAARRDVRQTGENIRNAGSDIVSNICGFWGNLLNGLSDTVSPQSGSRRSSNASARGRDESYGTRSTAFGCEGSEFRVSCGPGDAGAYEPNAADDRDSPESDKQTRA